MVFDMIYYKKSIFWLLWGFVHIKMFYVLCTYENIKKILSHFWNKFHIQRPKHGIFCLLHIFYGFWTNLIKISCSIHATAMNICFLEILHTACNTWHDFTTACYFHIAKIWHNIFTTWKYQPGKISCLFNR